MSLREKLKMTEEEKVNWRTKLDALKVFSNTFHSTGRVLCFDNKFYTSLTIKEILSDEFEKELKEYVLKLDPNRNIPFAYIIQRKNYEEKSVKEFFSSLTEDEWHEFYDRIIEPVPNLYAYGLEKVKKYDFFNYVAEMRDDYEAFIYCIGNYGDYVEKGFINSSTLDSMITKAFLSKDTTDLEKLAKFVSKKFKNFHNYSPILFNEALDSDTRSKLLKSFYRQKDLPQYKEFLRKHRDRLDILDTFIDVTITNNNRVTEKDANFINLLIAIYVTTSSYSYSSLNREESLVGLKQFTEKYKKYFLDAGFLSKFFSYSVGSMQKEVYARRKEFDNFMSAIFSAYSVDEILDSLFNTTTGSTVSGKNFAGATEPIAETLKDKFSHENLDLNKKLVRFFLARKEYETVRTAIKRYGEDLNDFADVITPYVDGYFKHSTLNKQTARGIDSDLSADIFGDKDIIKNLHSLHYTNDSVKCLLGFKRSAVNASENNYYLLNTYKLHSALLAIYEKVFNMSNGTKEVAKSFYDVYLDQYLTDTPFEESIREIPLLVSDSNTKELQHSYWGSSNSKPTLDAYIELIKKIKDLGEKYLPLLKDEIPEETQNTILETLDSIVTNVSLLCAI